MATTVAEARKALATAEAEYLSELEQDAKRSEGSGAQERRREERQDAMREKIYQCKLALEHAERTEQVRNRLAERLSKLIDHLEPKRTTSTDWSLANGLLDRVDQPLSNDITDSEALLKKYGY